MRNDTIFRGTRSFEILLQQEHHYSRDKARMKPKETSETECEPFGLGKKRRKYLSKDSQKEQIKKNLYISNSISL